MNNIAVIEKIADRIINGGDTNWEMNIEQFDWCPGVGLYGIFKAYEATGKQKYLDFLNAWFNRHLSCAYNKLTVNSTAPLLTAIELYSLHGNPEYLKVCTDIADDIITNAPLTREGGLEHTVTETGAEFKEEIWADTLFMVCIFIAKLGRITGENKYKEFALNQLKIHHTALRDENMELYYHAWNCIEKNHMSAVHWGRANAWIIYSTIEILRTLDCVEENKELIANHAKALKVCQRENGAFGTILDDVESYNEISATAGITAGLAKSRALGILDSSFDVTINKAVSIIKKSVNEWGEIEGVSTGTPVMPSADAYKKIKCYPTLYGQGMAILALFA